MIYIIGVDHERQHGVKDFSELKDYLEKQVKNKSINLVAEESSYQALEKWGVDKSVAQKLCESLNIKHIFADPNILERKILGIQLREDIAKKLGFLGRIYDQKQEAKINDAMKPYDRLREKEWLERIKSHVVKNMIFLCGYEHSKMFLDLLISEGYDGAILTEFR